MPGPTLTDAERAQLLKEKNAAEAAAVTFNNAVAGQAARAAQLAVVDGSFKKFYDYYNSIITSYDLEQRWLNGREVTLPVLEADIVDCASLGGGRLQPGLPATDVVRITQFDGTPTTTNIANESQYITDQAAIETALVSGYGGSSLVGVTTTSTITSASTTLSLTSTSTYSITPNSIYVVTDGFNLAVIKVLTFIMQVSPVPPPYIANCTIEVLVPPSGTITTGQQLQAFNGFTNAERTAKTASNPNLQSLMNYLIAQLQAKVNGRITCLNGQLSAIAGNQEPEPGSELTTATTNVNTSKTFLTNYLVTTIISNTGLTSLSTERSTRSGQISTRVSQINSAYTGRSQHYYNQRYLYANNRANTSRGTLRLQKNSEQVSAQSATFAATLTAQASAIGDLLS